MEQDGYAPGESIAFDFENGSGTYTYQGKIAGSFVSADTYLVIPEGVYRSMNLRGTAYGYLWVDCDKKDVASVEQSLNTLISNASHIKMDTYHAQLQYAEYTSRMMKLGCYLFMAIVGLIGFMNLANTMIINTNQKNHNKKRDKRNVINVHSKNPIMLRIGKQCIAKGQTGSKCDADGANRKNQAQYL